MKSKIIIAKNSGFCPGVKSAIRKTLEAIELGEGPVFTIGPVIHNPGVIAALEARGATMLKSVSEAPEDAVVVVRAHGLPQVDWKTIKTRRLGVVDAECVSVKKAGSEIKRAIAEKRQIYLAGDPKHAETIAHVSIAPNRITVISSASDTAKMEIPDVPSTLVAQTTFSPDEFSEIENELKKSIGDKLAVCQTICPYTLKAGKSAAEAAGRADITIVIGGKNSANTNRLVEICRTVCPRVVLIESPDEINAPMIAGCETIAITAGASTPPKDIQNAEKIIIELQMK